MSDGVEREDFGSLIVFGTVGTEVSATVVAAEWFRVQAFIGGPSFEAAVRAAGEGREYKCGMDPAATTGGALSRRAETMTADELVRELGLAPHPEGGFYRETWRDHPADGGRGSGTAILFLLPGGVENRWHRVDAAEVWHHYAGAPLELSIRPRGGPTRIERLGTALGADELPQRIVPPDAWQRARSLGAWTLVGCTVSPAFLFERFEIADGEPEDDGVA